jgi:glucose/arabinose dehydrogenase
MHTHRTTRTRLAGLVGAIALLAGLASSSTTGAAGAATVALTQVASGLDSPLQLTNARDGSGRLFVVEQTGKIKLIKAGVVQGTPFLDLSDEISHGGEQGLLGLAFHPSYKTNGLFYVNFTRANGDTVVNRYRVSTTNPDVAVRATGYRIITIAQPYDNHNGGMIAFGPDGYLYIGMGDGGSAGDPGNRAQRLDTDLGKMLRINVNGSVGARHFLIPSSNPWVGKVGWDEIWSRGLRNPWRFSFDRKTGDLWIGDVGQNRFEEIDRSKVSSSSTSRGRGVNYGWRLMEGRHCYNPSTGCTWSGKVIPVVEYGHVDGACSVTGGYVYRGAKIPALYGRYVFADYCNGTIWSIPNTAASPATPTTLLSTSMNISSFGEDGSSELYVVDHGGAVYRFTKP